MSAVRTVLFMMIFTQGPALAGDTFSHAVQGALLHGTIVKLAGGSKTAVYIGAASGAAFGAYPDIAGAWGNIVEHDNWQRYSFAHRGVTIASYVPAYRLHLWVDIPFHSPSGGWKENAWVLETFMIVVDFILTYLFIQWVES